MVSPHVPTTSPEHSPGDPRSDKPMHPESPTDPLNHHPGRTSRTDKQPCIKNPAPPRVPVKTTFGNRCDTPKSCDRMPPHRISQKGIEHDTGNDPLSRAAHQAHPSASPASPAPAEFAARHRRPRSAPIPTTLRPRPHRPIRPLEPHPSPWQNIPPQFPLQPVRITEDLDPPSDISPIQQRIPISRILNRPPMPQRGNNVKQPRSGPRQIKIDQSLRHPTPKNNILRRNVTMPNNLRLPIQIRDVPIPPSIRHTIGSHSIVVAPQQPPDTPQHILRNDIRRQRGAAPPQAPT